MTLEYALGLLGDYLKTQREDVWGMLALKSNGNLIGWIYAQKGRLSLFSHIVFSDAEKERVTSNQMQEILYNTQEILFDTIKDDLVPHCANLDNQF